jgi:transcriptional regulator with XRE-family HTH domain
MDISDKWLERFKAVVTKEIDAAGGKSSNGYRAVAEKTGLGYDYVYQIFTGKPKEAPKRPTLEVMQKLSKAYPELKIPVDYSLEAEAGHYDITPTVGVVEPGIVFSHEAKKIAALYDLISESDLIGRAQAFSGATIAIVAVLEGHKSLPTYQPVADRKKQRV